MFHNEMENYCGNCGLQVEKTEGNCPHCGAPLSVTLVKKSRREREWINPDRWQIGRKGWIQAEFEKRWFPRFEEWLYQNKHKSLGELSGDEIRRATEEYKSFIEERKRERESWMVMKARSEEQDTTQRRMDKPNMDGFEWADTVQSWLEDEQGQITIKGGFHNLWSEEDEVSDALRKDAPYQAHIEILSADPKTGSSTLIRLHTSQAEFLYELLGIKLRQAKDWHNMVVKPFLDKHIARMKAEQREKEGQKNDEGK
jgi:hypothetical protein